MNPSNGMLLPPELEELLFELGLSPAEVRIYQFLLKSPSALPSLVATSTGESRGRIYQTMRRLAEKGFAQEEPTRPVQFSAVPLASILAMAQARFARHLKTLQEGEAALVKVTDSGARIPLLAATRARDVVVVSGRRACHKELRRMLAEATEFYWMVGGGNLVRRLLAMPTFLAEVKEGASRGLDVRILLSADSANATLAQKLTLEGRPLVHETSLRNGDPLVTCATDRASLEMVVQPDDDSTTTGADVAIQTTSAVLVKAAKKRIGGAAQRREEEQRAALYQWLGPNHGTDLFLGGVKNARRDVVVIGPADWNRYLTRSWNEMFGHVEAAKARGVRFRALLLQPVGEPPMDAAFARLWEIRIASWIPIWLTIVDGTKMYQAFPPTAPSSPPQFRESKEPNELRFYREVFESLWGSGTPFIHE